MARYNGRGTNEEAERQALLPDHNQHGAAAKPSGSTAGTSTSIASFLGKNIDTERADILLIVSFFISGMIDAGAYNAYECFTSMQTGNTVFAALGVSDLPVGQPQLAWTKSVTSVISFLLGCLLITLLHRTLGGTKRWVLSLSFLLQAVFIAVSAVLVQQGRSSGSPAGGGKIILVQSGFPKDPGFPWMDLVPIALLSFQAAGKVVTSRVTGQAALPVVVLTTLYNDLISDPGLFTGGLMGNVQRNRRFGGLVMYFLGATVGGLCASSSLGFSGGLGVAFAIQVGVAIAWAVWFEEKSGSRDQ